MTTKETKLRPQFNITFFRQASYAFSVLLIFILPWRALLEISDGVTAARLLGALTGVFWLMYLIFYGKVRKPHPFHVVLFLFVAWMGLSVLWTVDTIATLFTFFSIFSGASFCLVLWDLFRTKSSVATAALAYVTGCYVVIIIEGFNFLFLGSFRVGEVVSGPNYVTGRLVFGLPLAWYLISHQTPNSSKMMQYIGITYLPLASITTLLTQSRQGLVSLSAALILVTIAHLRKEEKLQSIIPSMFVGLLISILLINNILKNRLLGVLPIDELGRAFRVLTGDLAPSEANLDQRFEIYSAAIELFASNFLYGTGAGSFRTAVEPILGYAQAPHSTYLSVGVESGIIGIVLFTLLISSLLKGLFDFNSPSKMTGIILLMLYLLLSFVNTWLTDFTALFVLTIILLASKSLS
jgi:hypothetical protein